MTDTYMLVIFGFFLLVNRRVSLADEEEDSFV